MRGFYNLTNFIHNALFIKNRNNQNAWAFCQKEKEIKIKDERKIKSNRHI